MKIKFKEAVKALVSLSLAILMIIPLFASTAIISAVKSGDADFTDVSENDWFYDNVKYVSDNDIMKGVSADRFEPKSYLSRAMSVTVLYRMAGESDVDNIKHNFNDVADGEWYSDAVAWGVDRSLVKGLPNNRFCPSHPVTRQEVAVFIDRYSTVLNLYFNNTPLADTFKDEEEISDFASFSVELVRQNGLMGGDEKGYFNPKAHISRAEVATVITNLYPLWRNIKSEKPTGPFIFREISCSVRKIRLFRIEYIFRRITARTKNIRFSSFCITTAHREATT